MFLEKISAGQTAFGAITATAAATILFAVKAAASTTTISLVAYSALAISGSALGIASMSAYMDPDSTTANKYFENFKKHAAHILPVTYQFVSQVVIAKAIEGFGEAIKDGSYNAFSNLFNPKKKRSEQGNCKKIFEVY